MDQSEKKQKIGSYVDETYDSSDLTMITKECIDINAHKISRLLPEKFYDSLSSDLKKNLKNFEAFIFEELKLEGRDYDRYLIGIEEGVYVEEVRGFGNNGDGILLTFVIEVPVTKRWKMGKSRYRSDLRIFDFIEKKTILNNAHTNYVLRNNSSPDNGDNKVNSLADKVGVFITSII